MSTLDLHFFYKVKELLESGQTFVTVTVTGVKGSFPQSLGAKMVVLEGESLRPLVGTIGGGNVEAFSIKEARRRLKEDKAPFKESVVLNLNKDLGMTCGGEVTLLFERFGKPSWQVAIFGAGHVGQAIVRTLAPLDCEVLCVDERQEWLDLLPETPNVRTLCLSPIEKAIENLALSTFIVSVTPGHKFDLEVASAALQKGDFAYLGVIGSRPKALQLKTALSEQGISKERLEKLYCPIGLDFGGNDPNEVALSIVGQLLQCRDRLLSMAQK